MALSIVCFTLNNFTEKEEQALKDGFGKWYDYMIVGHEHMSPNVFPNSKLFDKQTEAKKWTPHLQGYFETCRPLGSNKPQRKSLKQVKMLLGNRAHIEKRWGTQFQAIEYCKKEGDYWELGTPRKQGARSDLDGLREMANTDGMREVTSYCTAQQITIASKFLTYNETMRDLEIPPTVTWIWGPSGCGKSTYARAMVQGKDYYSKDDTKWWDGYDRHQIIWLDDFRLVDYRANFLLKLLDKFPLRLEVKGGFRQVAANEFVITSILCPRCAWHNAHINEPYEQLRRRLTSVITVVSKGVFEPVECVDNYCMRVSDLEPDF